MPLIKKNNGQKNIIPSPSQDHRSQLHYPMTTTSSADYVAPFAHSQQQALMVAT